MTTGTEWLVDATGCDPKRLGDLRTMRELCDEIVSDLKLRTIGAPLWHQFPSPGGVTGMYLLTESHLTCHTFPEFGLATFNLYCCQSHADWPWRTRLSERAGASLVSVRCLPRGAESPLQHEIAPLLGSSGRGPS